ncbi:hypothetical protein XAP6164_1590025 [Xanthomonas phaseoli pv. phaseoli]|nr:hypothetical protein XAP6164_1590025 [Xanthomonas phaseoli pv. phaseoli]
MSWRLRAYVPGSERLDGLEATVCRRRAKHRLGTFRSDPLVIAGVNREAALPPVDIKLGQATRKRESSALGSSLRRVVYEVGHTQPGGLFLRLRAVGESPPGRPERRLTDRPPWQSLGQLRIGMRVVHTCTGAGIGLGSPLFLALPRTPAHCRRHCHRMHTSPRLDGWNPIVLLRNRQCTALAEQA